MKKILGIFAAAFLLTLFGCGEQKTETTQTNQPSNNVETRNDSKTWVAPPVDDNIQAKAKAVEEKAVDLKNVEFPEGAFKIVVSENGFTPQEISFKQNQSLKLAFYRADDKNCADEIVFKDLNIKKKLPVGKLVLVDIPTDKTGEISFACGMNMMKGKIVIQ